MTRVRTMAVSAAAAAVLAVTLTGCQSPSLESSCNALISAASKSALTVTNLLTSGEVGFTKLEAAAAEVEGYMEPLRDIELSQEIEPLRDSLVADMDTLVMHVRAYDSDGITTVAQNMAKTAVDIDLACR